MFLVLRFIAVWAAAQTLSSYVWPQHGPTSGQQAEDFYRVRVDVLELVDEDIFDGFAKLNQRGFSKFSIEYALKPKLVGPLSPNPKFSERIEGRSLEEVLTWLCALDGRYVWRKGFRTTHIVSREVVDDPEYLMNRIIPALELREVSDAGRAALAAFRQVPGEKGQIAFLQLAGSVSFAKPWSVTRKNITLREAFDLIAAQLGDDFGWQLTGAEDFQLLSFHNKLVSRTQYEKGRQRHPLRKEN